MIGKPYYSCIPIGLLALNFIVQRIFRINSSVPFSVHFTSRVYGFNNIKLGKNVKQSFILSGGANIQVSRHVTLEIGDDTIFARNVCIMSSNHGLLERNKTQAKSIKIGKNCWLGQGVVILPGVNLGDNVTVAANAVVNKSFPSNVVIGGIPAKILKNIEDVRY